MSLMKDLTPKKIVNELDKYIISQYDAKKAVAIALRNRWRRQQVSGDIQKEITPNNIILIGPTGVGKTEISRRLSNLANAPFIKIEASKFTQVGYVGRDVESMIRELLEISIAQVRKDMLKEVTEKAKEKAREVLLDILIKPPSSKFDTDDDYDEKMERYYRSREKMEKKLDNGDLDDREVEIPFEKSQKASNVGFFSNMNMESIDLNIGEIVSSMMPKKSKDSKVKKVKVKKAIKILKEQEAQKLVKKDKVIEVAKERTQNNGIIFIDEIDKIASKNRGDSKDISKTGVQRDLLPIVEGSTVPTKHGMIDTSHILFIAAGAFTMAKPSDLIPELQGRFPIRVELSSLSEEDFVKILKYPKSALLKQYKALLATENVELDFEEEAIKLLAHFAFEANLRMEDIGARRLHTILNKLLEKYMFEIPEIDIDSIVINEEIVREVLKDIIEDKDLAKYIL